MRSKNDSSRGASKSSKAQWSLIYNTVSVNTQTFNLNTGTRSLYAWLVNIRIKEEGEWEKNEYSGEKELLNVAYHSCAREACLPTSELKRNTTCIIIKKGVGGGRAFHFFSV